MADRPGEIALSMEDLRAIAGYCATCAQEILGVFERARPGDARPREAIDAAWTFARGGARGKALRVAALAAQKAAGEARMAAASDAARAAMCAASAAYLHPLANAHQVKHILGAAAFAARAAELIADGDRAVGAERIEQARQRAPQAVIDTLKRYPPAPPGGGRAGELMRDLDAALRGGS